MTRIPEGYMEDAKGNLIPLANVREIDQKRDDLVRGLVDEAKAHSGTLATFKASAQEAISGFVQESAKALKTKVGGVKGNVTLMSFDGKYKVCSQNQDFFVFDERLQVAKSLVDRCIQKWSEGANSNLLALVNAAFDVDGEGNVNAKKVLALKSLEIDDPNWRKAMEAIGQALTLVSSKNYVRFYERLANGEYKQISLNIAVE
jgi:hypothetical protein